ncbi:hypothetical protein J7L13_00930 [bacterium]|nr:hypothetical protein [bacterium]
MSATPLLGSEAVIQKDGTDIGYAKSVTVSIDVDLIKEYVMGSTNPAVLKAGNKSFSVSIEKMFIDNAFANDVLNGTPVSIVVRPGGTGSGKPEITLQNVIFTSWELSIEQDGVVMESVEGEAESITFSTQSSG